MPEEKRIDGLFVLECMENGDFDKILFKGWDKKIVLKRAKEFGRALGKVFI